MVRLDRSVVMSLVTGAIAALTALGSLGFTHRVSALEFGLVSESRFEPVPLAAPFFVLGPDEISQQWLFENADYFRSRAAIGYVITDRGLADLDAFRERAGGYLQLYPLPRFKALAELYGLVGYPVFVDTRSGVVRQ